jgi:hypothetical protein
MRSRASKGSEIKVRGPPKLQERLYAAMNHFRIEYRGIKPLLSVSSRVLLESHSHGYTLISISVSPVLRFSIPQVPGIDHRL